MTYIPTDKAIEAADQNVSYVIDSRGDIEEMLKAAYEVDEPLIRADEARRTLALLAKEFSDYEGNDEALYLFAMETESRIRAKVVAEIVEALRAAGYDEVGSWLPPSPPAATFIERGFGPKS